MQTYLCKDCKSRFRNKRRNKSVLIKKLWFDYVFNKQTYRELSKRYDLDKRTIRELLNQYQSPAKQHFPREVHLLVDATYFGKRREGEYWCVLVARDAYSKENIAWLFSDYESTSAYSALRDNIEQNGYAILSVTGDGFSGIKSAFFGIPYQMCHVHMERLITEGTTKKPQTEAGQVLLALTKTLHNTNSHVFTTRLNQYIKKYSSFLNERTYNPETGRREWTHRPLRSAATSLVNWRKYLFTYEHHKNIPKTTNSLEGHFSHLKSIVKLHRGANKAHTQMVIHSILLSSTIAPKDKTKRDII